jgi:cytochrome c oxidase subunit 2
MMKRLIPGLALAVLMGAVGPALANRPVDGGMTLVPAASKLAEEVHFFHNSVLLPIITVISLLVLALLLWVIVRYNAKANPVPRKFSHNTLVEVIWTGIPILILLVIALFSFDLLFKEGVVPDGKQIVAEADGSTNVFSFDNDFPATRMVSAQSHVQVFLGSGSEVRGLAPGKDYTLAGLGTPKVSVSLTETPKAGDKLLMRVGRSLIGVGSDKEIALAPTMTLKVIGYQWGWTYAYPDFGNFEYSSNMAPESSVPKEVYRFEVDNRVVVPVGETIRVVTTARDVIHAWALPNMAIKVDAVPGRHNETWFKADREGVFYGQCSEICGVRHSAMPIAVEVVSRAAFEAWIDARRVESGMEPMFSKVAAAATSAAEPTPVVAEAPAAPGADTVAATPVVSAELQATVERCQSDLNQLTSSETINFASGGSTISDESRGFLDRIANVAKGCSDAFIRIGGHTDSSGDADANIRLSKARADAVAAYLVGAGFPQDRLSAEGFGPSVPVADNATPDGRAKNRRIEFTVAATAGE